MKDKHEIHALDYAIAKFVSALDHLFRAVSSVGLQIAWGLNVETIRDTPQEVKVFIRPVSWDTDSGISGRFHKSGEGSWEAFEGALIARHLPQEFSAFNFECWTDWRDNYGFRGRGTNDEILLKRLLTARAATEIKQD